MKLIKHFIINVLRDYADKIEADNSNLTQSDALELLSQISHIEISKQQLSDRYSCSTKTIERAESDGRIPPSHPTRYSKKVWYLDEIINNEIYVNDYENDN